jgi:predicted RNase H-like nuclease (RuvC/YqgF family)
MSFGGGDVETKLSDVITKNEQLERENALFASYLERVAPSTGAEEDDAPEATPTAKKGKSKVVLPKEVALEQKTELAQQEVDDLKDEIELTKAESEKLLDRLQAITEECDMRIAQVKKDVYEFRREIVIGGESARTGKIVAEKVIRYFEEKLRAKVCPRRLPAARVLSSNPPGYPRWRRSPRSLRQPTVSCTRCCG